VAVHDLDGDDAPLDQLLVAVQVVEHEVEQLGALGPTRFDRRPVVARDDNGIRSRVSG
jgi:hypothetical protein